MDWQLGAVLARIEAEMAGRPAGGRGWYVTRELHTMTVVSGPVEFMMGSPRDEVGRTQDEEQHRVWIPRSFAIATKEVTVAQFRRFLDSNPDIKRTHAFADDPLRMADVMRRFSPDDDGPQIAVTWYEAAAYCNWLSAQEGIARSEWVYPTALQDGMQMPNDYLRRTGYRLPTEAEWEFAARAGSAGAHFFGNDASQLKHYAWHRSVAPKAKDDPVPAGDPTRTWPVGQLKPNDLGLFDVYGNVWEWAQDRRQEYPSSRAMRDDVEDTILAVADSVGRVRRGGSFSYEPAMQRSAHRGTTNAFPGQRRDNVGFRVARTMRP
jgi:formylglycine-generating enzyme required for sulfatase activity